MTTWAFELRSLGPPPMESPMAWKHLRTGEMLSLTSPLLDPQHPEQQALSAEPLTAAILPYVEGAHQRLLKTQVRDNVQARVAELGLKQAEVDSLHDALKRAVYDMLGAAAIGALDQDYAARCNALRALVLPEGYSGLNRSYRDEAGQAALLAERLGADEIALLEGIRIGSRSAWSLLQQVLELAAELGRLQDEREKAEREGASPADVVAARNRWIRVINVLMAAIELIEEPSAALLSVTRRFGEAEKRVNRRGSGQNSTPEPSAPSEPTEPSAS